MFVGSMAVDLCKLCAFFLPGREVAPYLIPQVAVRGEVPVSVKGSTVAIIIAWLSCTTLS